MDKEQVRETIEQLVESQYDRLQAQTRLRNLQDAHYSPLAPSEFESLEAFLEFHGPQHEYEEQMRSLKTEQENVTKQYDQARAALSRVLPTNALLHYTYEGDREELKDQQYDIVNVASPGGGQIRIAQRPAQP
jgi:hypothetical protein